jgi:5-methylcytosine-specific restriction endonuclease McrA
MIKGTRISKVSKKQSQRNREIAESKKELIEQDCLCRICRDSDNVQLMHILPKSLYPEYYTERWNHTLGCQRCHNKFDDDVNFRTKVDFLYDQVCAHDKRAADKYFRR